MDKRLASAISRLGQTYIPGSSATKGYLYNPLPFPGCENIPCHRPNSPERWEIIERHTDFKDKTVLDLGCATGYFSFKAQQAGAKIVVGLDHDANAVNVCRAAKEIYKVHNCHFWLIAPTSELLERYDIAFAMSVLNWLGQDLAESWLHWVEEYVDEVWIELPLAGDGRRGATWVKDIPTYLSQWFAHVDHLGTTAAPHRGKPRPLYRCTQ
jgi:SAM-dependent methyltransferase